MFLNLFSAILGLYITVALANDTIGADVAAQVNTTVFENEKATKNKPFNNQATALSSHEFESLLNFHLLLEILFLLLLFQSFLLIYIGERY